MMRQVCGERVGQVFAQRRRIAQQPDVPAQPLAVLLQLAAHLIDLLQHRACVMLERMAGIGRLHARLRPVQQRYAQFVLHAADALARGLQRDVGPLGAARDRAGLADVPKEPQVGQIEAHGRSGASGREWPIS
jgi:AcrR family transcriptional regulator